MCLIWRQCAFDANTGDATNQYLALASLIHFLIIKVRAENAQTWHPVNGVLAMGLSWRRNHQYQQKGVKKHKQTPLINQPMEFGTSMINIFSLCQVCCRKN